MKGRAIFGSTGSQFSDMFPKEFPKDMFSIAPHFYPIFALPNVVLLSPLYRLAEGEELYISR